MRPLEDFYNHVRLDVPQVGLPYVRQAILDACRDFMKRTHIWQEEKIWALGADKSEYKLAIPENTYIQDIDYMARRVVNSDPVKYADRTRYKRTIQDMDWESRNWREQTSGVADFWRWGIKSDRRTVFVYPRPSISYPAGVKCNIILAPNQDAFEVLDILFDEWGEHIGAGASAKLLATPKKEWTDYEAAKMRRAQFNKAVAAALRKSTTELPRVKFRGLGDAQPNRTR